MARSIRALEQMRVPLQTTESLISAPSSIRHSSPRTLFSIDAPCLTTKPPSRIETERTRGIYRVTDSGPMIKGKRLDVYIPGWARAVEFGRKAVKVTVLRYGDKQAREAPPRFSAGRTAAAIGS